MQTVDAETRAAISKALQFLDIFRNLDENMPIGEVVTFLHIAQSPEGITLREIGEKGGFVQSSASRYVQDLGELDRNRKPGHEVIKEKVDLMDRRNKLRELTPKGRRLLSQVVNVFGGK